MGLRALSVLRRAASEFAGAGIEDEGKEAETLLVAASGLDRVALYRDDPELDEAASRRFDEMLQRRLSREPMAYVVGFADFFGLRMNVGPGVLIPRPETELIAVELLKRAGPPGTGVHVLDLCAGSGCLALAVASRLPLARVYASDSSGAALRYAVENARINGIGNVTFLEGDLFGAVGGARFDFIISNPPYIKSGDIASLQPEIRDWEPREAIDGGEDGLDFHRRILTEAPGHLRPGGRLVLELGAGQASEVSSLALREGLYTIDKVKDLCGVERVIVLGLSS